MKGFDLMMKFKKTEHEQLTFFKYLLAAHLLFTGCGHHLVNNQGKYIYIYKSFLLLNEEKMSKKQLNLNTLAEIAIAQRFSNTVPSRSLVALKSAVFPMPVTHFAAEEKCKPSLPTFFIFLCILCGDMYCTSIKPPYITHRLMACVDYSMYILKLWLGSWCQRRKSILAVLTHQRERQPRTHAKAQTSSHIMYHEKQSSEVRSVKWESHQSGSRVQWRPTSAGLVVTEAHICR